VLGQKIYNQEEREALRRGAVGHWAGGAARWLLATGCTRAQVCRLRWCDVENMDREHPLYPEMRVRRQRAAELARGLGLPLGPTRVFLNYYGQQMNPTTLNDRLREMIRRGRTMRDEKQREEGDGHEVHAREYAGRVG